MGIIWYGVKNAGVGVDEFMIRCPSCEADQFADVMITSNYYHIYYIPIFPFEKEANVICHKCGLKRFNIPFNEKNFKNYHEIKPRFKHPLYTYTFLIACLLLILAAIFIPK